MSRELRRLAALAAAAVAASAHGQTPGAIAGVATDSDTGRPLVGAIAQLTGPGSDPPRTVVSEEGGEFTFGELPGGAYALTVRLDGYQAFARAGLAVKEGETLRVGAWLTPEGREPAEVVVTGSRIRRKDVTSAAPVTVIDRKQIEESGVVGLGELLQRLPAQIGGLNAKMNAQSQGQVLISLRGLESRRTLVLVNGRRMVGGGLGGETMVDLDTIPLAAVERVEVMMDGASAIYGSDAIAGVVNVILKRRFEGTEVSATGGTSSRGDGESYDVSASTGVTGKRGSVFVSVGYQEQRPIYATARRWSQDGQRFDFNSRSVVKDRSWYIPAGVVGLADPEGACADPGAISSPALRSMCQHYQAGEGSEFVWDKQAGAYRPRADDDTYDYQEHAYLLTPARRLQLFSAGNTQLGKEARAFYEASFVSRRSSRQLPAMPADLSISADNPYNDLGTDVYAYRRMSEVGLRRYREEIDTYRLALGIEGEVGTWAGPLQGWHWEVSYVWGRNSARDTSDGQLRVPQLTEALGSCSSPGCVPIDVLHGETTLTAAQRQYVSFSGTAHGFQEQHVASAGVSGRLFDLWSNRPAGLAAGVELRRESGGYFPDPVSAAGEASEGNQPAVAGRYSSREAYAELSLPLLAQRLLVQDLELTAALRNVDYTTFGSNTTYKLAGRWTPVADVTLRGTWSTAFRAPGILEMYTGTALGAESATDPCVSPATPAVEQQCRRQLGGSLPTGHGETQVEANVGGNPGLRAERATVLTTGLVLQPRWVRGLSFTVDYWDIRLKDAVEYMGAATILARCYTGTDSAYCDRVQRDASGNISLVDDRLTNVGETRTSGVDVAARSVLPTPGAGAFTLGLDLTYLVRYDRTYADGKVDKAAGTYDLKLLLPRWKWNAQLGWQYGPITAGAEARYIGSIKECAGVDGMSGGGDCSANPELSRRVRSNVVFDLNAGYELRSGLGTTRLTVGVRNVLDTAPPKIFNADWNNTEPDYAYEGRYYWARLAQSF